MTVKTIDGRLCNCGCGGDVADDICNGSCALYSHLSPEDLESLVLPAKKYDNGEAIVSTVYYMYFLTNFLRRDSEMFSRLEYVFDLDPADGNQDAFDIKYISSCSDNFDIHNWFNLLRESNNDDRATILENLGLEEGEVVYVYNTDQWNDIGNDSNGIEYDINCIPHINSFTGSTPDTLFYDNNQKPRGLRFYKSCLSFDISELSQYQELRDEEGRLVDSDGYLLDEESGERLPENDYPDGYTNTNHTVSTSYNWSAYFRAYNGTESIDYRSGEKFEGIALITKCGAAYPCPTYTRTVRPAYKTEEIVFQCGAEMFNPSKLSSKFYSSNGSIPALGTTHFYSGNKVFLSDTLKIQRALTIVLYPKIYVNSTQNIVLVSQDNCVRFPFVFTMGGKSMYNDGVKPLKQPQETKEWHEMITPNTETIYSRFLSIDTNTPSEPALLIRRCRANGYFVQSPNNIYHVFSADDDLSNCLPSEYDGNSLDHPVQYNGEWYWRLPFLFFQSKTGWSYLFSKTRAKLRFIYTVGCSLPFDSGIDFNAYSYGVNMGYDGFVNSGWEYNSSFMEKHRHSTGSMRILKPSSNGQFLELTTSKVYGRASKRDLQNFYSMSPFVAGNPNELSNNDYYTYYDIQNMHRIEYEIGIVNIVRELLNDVPVDLVLRSNQYLTCSNYTIHAQTLIPQDSYRTYEYYTASNDVVLNLQGGSNSFTLTGMLGSSNLRKYPIQDKVYPNNNLKPYYSQITTDFIEQELNYYNNNNINNLMFGVTTSVEQDSNDTDSEYTSINSPPVYFSYIEPAMYKTRRGNNGTTVQQLKGTENCPAYNANEE